jgi:hypothetical protein
LKAKDIKASDSPYLDLLSRNGSFLSSIPTIATAVEKNARLIIIASAQGSCPLPYPDNVSHRRGVMMTAWPPSSTAASSGNSIGGIGSCEGFSMALNSSQVLPIHRDVTLERQTDSDTVKSMAEVEGEEEAKIVAQVQLASSSETHSTCKPLLRVFSASSLIGIALALLVASDIASAVDSTVRITMASDVDLSSFRQRRQA